MPEVAEHEPSWLRADQRHRDLVIDRGLPEVAAPQPCRLPPGPRQEPSGIEHELPELCSSSTFWLQEVSATRSLDWRWRGKHVKTTTGTHRHQNIRPTYGWPKVGADGGPSVGCAFLPNACYRFRKKTVACIAPLGKGIALDIPPLSDFNLFCVWGNSPPTFWGLTSPTFWGLTSPHSGGGNPSRGFGG